MWGREQPEASGRSEPDWTRPGEEGVGKRFREPMRSKSIKNRTVLIAKMAEWQRELSSLREGKPVGRSIQGVGCRGPQVPRLTPGFFGIWQCICTYASHVRGSLRSQRKRVRYLELKSQLQLHGSGERPQRIEPGSPEHGSPGSTASAFSHWVLSPTPWHYFYFKCRQINKLSFKTHFVFHVCMCCIGEHVHRYMCLCMHTDESCSITPSLKTGSHVSCTAIAPYFWTQWCFGANLIFLCLFLRQFHYIFTCEIPDFCPLPPKYWIVSMS